ncbi:nitrate reductase formation protein NapD [Bosea sp. F3-2]|jgi:periplasmic nitrate reductase NapD|uniref:chaperone NapD n=1 Tax=Bosea sp. F3-2 TaxID=2599640 RepID=UPI0011EBE40E|nr:chaperone NapD [Bosea sp. F3-2]QEL22740.1 nitrate reductase formation protein NapD [Bosea sp. F3-2]
MAEPSRPRFHHISSAVVSALPAHVDAVLASIRELPETEIHRVENGKIVIVLEGASTGVIGDRLAAISLLDGVLSANMVFEQIEDLEKLDDPGVDP